MSNRQPRKTITRPSLDNGTQGNTRRRHHVEDIVANAPTFPKPLEYKDIDEAVLEWVKRDLTMVIGGEETPVFTLFSGQRFTEYMQTWSHTDDTENLMMNFLLFSRENDPKTGSGQKGWWNIPGDRRYTIGARSVVEDDGREVYEIYSMNQPFTVDFAYRIDFITHHFANLNMFNTKLHKLFRSRQLYIQPNGHYVPMTLESVSDGSTYDIARQKFFIQNAVIKVNAYIIEEGDFHIDRIPKRPSISLGDRRPIRPKVELVETESDGFSNGELRLELNLKAWQPTIQFTMDCDGTFDDSETANVSTYRIWVNDKPIFGDKGNVIMHKGDRIRVKVWPISESENARVTLIGFDPNVIIKPQDKPSEFVSEDSNRVRKIEPNA